MDQPNFADIERLLSKILPPKAILALGAVMPKRLLQLSKFAQPALTLVHPDDAYLRLVTEAQEVETIDLNVSSQAISPSGGDVSFFDLSLNRESGFVPPAALKPIWKNLEQISETDISSQTLQEFIHDAEPEYNWLILDRLDGLHLIEGALECLNQLDVICLRSWRGDDEPELRSTQQAAAFLTAQGFRLIAQAPERHPSLEALLFAKDYGQVSEQLKAYKSGQDSDVEKQKKLALNNLAALEQRYADLLAKHKKTEKLVADILTRLSRAEAAFGTDE